MKNKIAATVKKFLKKSLLLLGLGVLCALAVSARAAFIFGSGISITGPSNSVCILTNIITISPQPVTVQIVTTNGATITTNSFVNSLLANASNSVAGATSVFNANGFVGTTNFTYSPSAFNVTNYLFLNTTPQSGGSNVFTIQVQ